MIVYDLICPKNHRFEGWFRDASAFDAQVSSGEVVCPTCGAVEVKKALSAPNLANNKKSTEPPSTPAPVQAAPGKATLETTKAAEVRQALQELRKTVEENFEYVGNTFAEEARKIHYGESDQRNIYGETSDEEAAALNEEGVEVSRIPWIRREDS